MSSQVAEAGRVAPSDPTRAEELYRGVLSRKAGESAFFGRPWGVGAQETRDLEEIFTLLDGHKSRGSVFQNALLEFEGQHKLMISADEDDLRDQEVALGKLGALYRDHE